MREIRHHLPTRYYRELPKLATRELAGTARVYAMAVELLRYSDARLDPQRLDRFMNAYQTVAPLSIGELWAWPSMLKLALIEHLRRLVRGTAREPRGPAARRTATSPRSRARGRAAACRRCRASCTSRSWTSCCSACANTAPAPPDCASSSRSGWTAAGTTVEDAVRAEHQRQAMNHLSMGNSITSLRLCATLDWNEYVEDVSLIEQILQRDPSGRLRAHGLREPRSLPPRGRGAGGSDRRSAGARRPARDRERAPGGREAGVRSARGARGLPPDRAAAAASSRSTWRTSRRSRQRLERLLFAHATPVYLGALALLTGAGRGGGRGRGARGRRAAAGCGPGSGAARADPRERARGRAPAPCRPPGRPAAAAAAARPARRRARVARAPW